MPRTLALLISLILLGYPAHADEVTDTLGSAIQAYEEGDLRYALEELNYVQQLVNEKRQSVLESFLPETPDGWAKQDNNNYNNGGQGLNATAFYRNGNEQLTIAIMLDSPMVVQMATVFSNPTALSSQGKLVRIGRIKFLEQGNQLTGVVDGRILVQASGSDKEMLQSVIKSIDLAGLGRQGI